MLRKLASRGHPLRRHFSGPFPQGEFERILPAWSHVTEDHLLALLGWRNVFLEFGHIEEP
jgi:hypothetical protein